MSPTGLEVAYNRLSNDVFITEAQNRCSGIFRYVYSVRVSFQIRRGRSTRSTPAGEAR
jgi:hypothetical protein